MAPQMAALPWYGAGDTPLDEPLVLCGTCAFSKKEVQNAGHAFWDRFEEPLAKLSNKGKKDGSSPSPRSDERNSAETERERAFREKREKKQRESKGKDGGLLKMSEELKGEDLYKLLLVEPGVTAEDLKKSYRKLVLLHHPDKMVDATEDQKKHFLLIQEAYEIVSDPDKKRRYESTLEFDDYIPTAFGRGKLAEADFFETFRPVFKSNARWSNRPKVPELGDESTPIEAVKDFYDFWYSFESWRDPLAMAEKEDMDLHNLEEADCREEKRWMERENAKVARKLAAGERERVMDLVKAAEKNDPRMIKHKEEQWQQKEAQKERKAAALRAEKEKKEAEARAKAEVEEAKRRVEEAKRLEERKKKEETKNALKTARQRLRTLHKNAATVVRHNVHADQLQEVCLRLETDALNNFCGQLEAEIAKVADASFGDVISLLHSEIEKCGATPIVDPSVDPSGQDSNASTVTGDSADDLDGSEMDCSPQKPARELTPEELEAERLRCLAEEAAEQERQERRAEEQRKKREQQRKQEEQRVAAVRKLEKKEAEAAKKQQAKALKEQEQKAKQVEEQRLRSQQQAEEQRLANLAEEQERRQQHEEQLVARAFEADRYRRIAILEAYDDALLEAALPGTLLQEGAEQPNVQLAAALKQIAAELPPLAASKAEAADPDRREAEDLCVDAGLGCLVAEGGAGAAPEEARARLAQALALAVRPSQDIPELSKDAKASVKKARIRVRGAVLGLLRSLLPAAPAAAAAPAKVAASPTAPKPEAVKVGTELLVAEEGTLFESLSSYEDLGVVAEGKVVVASGAPQEVEGFYMVPIKPRGAVELRLLRVVAASAGKGKAAASAGKAGKASKAATASKAAEPELCGRLLEFVRLAAQGPSAADADEDDFLEACLGGFDPKAALAEAAGATAKADAIEAGAAEAAKTPAAKPGKKAKAAKADEEDLDALLEEFGMTSQGPSKSKRKGKK